MKLLVDAHIFDDYSQGSKTYLKGLYASLLDKKPDWNFLLAAHNTQNLNAEFGPHENLKSVGLKSKNKFVRLAWELSSIIRDQKCELAHFQYISPVAKQCSEVVTIHDLLFLDFPEYFPVTYRMVKDFLFKRSAKRADLILTVSEYAKESIIRHYKLPEERIVITPNGVLNFFLESHPVLPDIQKRYGVDQYILYVSRIEPRKNQDGLLRVYLDLKLWKKGIQLVFVGGVGVPNPQFTSLLNSLGPEIRTKILIFQDLQLDELKAFYRNCKLFVYPSFAEGFGIPPLEAASCGSNVLCSNRTAMGEFRFLGDRLFNPADEGSFKEKVNHFLNQGHPGSGPPETLEHIKKHYSWESSADSFLKGVSRIGH